LTSIFGAVDPSDGAVSVTIGTKPTGAGFVGSRSTVLARLRGFADFEGVRSLFINELDGEV
jgi:hypothetical protein